MATGQFVKSGGQMFTTYSATPEGASQLINDFYDGGWTTFYGSFAKSAGNGPSFDGGFGYSGGMFNPKYGMDVTAAMFSGNTIAAMIQKRAYDHEGMRMVKKFATYGMMSDITFNGQSVTTPYTPVTHSEDVPPAPNNPGTYPEYVSNAPLFGGLGAGTVPDGKLPDPVAMDYDMIRIPHKELPFAYNYGLTMKALEAKDDDTASYKQYIDLLNQNYSNLMDLTLLRPLTQKMPKVSNYAWKDYTHSAQTGIETGLTGLARVFSSRTEIGKQYYDRFTNGLVTVDADMVSPWGGTTGDMYRLRCESSADASTVESNYDAQITDADGNVPSLGLFDEMYMKCMVNWDNNSPDGKFWLMSPLLWNKLSQLMKANNIYLDSVYATTSMSGVRTVEGRDVGMLLNSYNHIPIIMSANMSMNYTTGRVGFANYGDAFLLDGEHFWLSMLSPTEVWTIENPAITNDLREHTKMNMRAELRADKFIGSGRIVNLAH